MILNKENERRSSSPNTWYSPTTTITHLNFNVTFPPQNSNINKPTAPNTNLPTLFFSLEETMQRRPRTTSIVSLLTIFTFATFSIHLSRNAISTWHPYSDISKLNTTNHRHIIHNNNSDIIVNSQLQLTRQTRRVSSIKDSLSSFSTISVLIPDWEILVIVSPNTPLSSSHQHHCLFPNNAKSPAKFSGVLPFTNRTTFKCDLPENARRRSGFYPQPMLVTSETEFPSTAQAAELIKWNFLVYESFSTENDVVVFAKGVNHRNGNNRAPKELRCLFGIGNGVRTAVTSSVQEVFRCPHPDPSELSSDSYYGLPQRIGISIEIVANNIVVPSVAYYSPTPRPRPEIKPKNEGNSVMPLQSQPKHFLCACTMVYNVGKVLREWVMYNLKVGVENFILYDNGSDDDLYSVVNELRGEGYNITTLLWIWPKTQEAGFSHSVVYSKSKQMCKWMMYVDVDEFMFSPTWKGHDEQTAPSLKSLLPKEELRVGQVSVRCLEFGPSGKRVHPVEGVTQGYTCRRRGEQRHKSVVLVDGVDPSLRNVIHHFEVNEKEGYWTKQVSVEEGLVNHYKYQAWGEFKNKFRRRVSAYVVDWTQNVNAESKDRTPGLGFQAIEPKDWTHRFCEVKDLRLKSLTRAWFGSLTPHGYRMAWQKTS